MFRSCLRRGAGGAVRYSSTMAPVVVCGAQGSAGIATLNRPKVLNSLDLPMIKILGPALTAWQEDSAIKTIILRGEGGKAFCAGGDVVAVAKAASDDVTAGLEFFGEEYKLDHQISTLTKPFVALLDGIVMGGGVGLSVHGKFRVATERSLFAMPETVIGLFPDVGGSHFLPRLEGGLGMYLALTGNRLKGSDLVQAGIATHYVQSERLDDLVEALAAVAEPADVAPTLEKFSSPVEVASYDDVRAKIDSCFVQDSVADIIKALEDDGSEWATKQVGILRRASPVSLLATHEQLTRGKDKSLAECLQMEFGMCHRALLEPDFYEGIRAQLVDKDRKPKWSVGGIEELTREDIVERFFNPVNIGNFKI